MILTRDRKSATVIYIEYLASFLAFCVTTFSFLFSTFHLYFAIYVRGYTILIPPTPQPWVGLPRYAIMDAAHSRIEPYQKRDSLTFLRVISIRAVYNSMLLLEAFWALKFLAPLVICIRWGSRKWPARSRAVLGVGVGGGGSVGFYGDWGFLFVAPIYAPNPDGVRHGHTPNNTRCYANHPTDIL